jgi:hypothetical protein
MVDPQGQRVFLVVEDLAEFRNSKIDSLAESGAIAGPPFLPQRISATAWSVLCNIAHESSTHYLDTKNKLAQKNAPVLSRGAGTAYE